MSDYYEYYEIMMGLRKEYIKNQALLRVLEQQILIEGDNIDKIKIVAHLKSEIDRDDNATLTLNLFKILSTMILRKKRTIAYHSNITLNEDLHYTFLFSHIPNNFSPIATVENQTCFDDICDEIFKSDLLALPDLYTKVNGFQTLRISGSAISLDNSCDLVKRNEWLSLTYQSSSDSVNINSSEKCCTYDVEQLLKTEIPKYKINRNYIDVIDANIVPNSYFYVDDILNSKDCELVIKENSKPYVLTKKPK